MDIERYARAEKLLPRNRSELVFGDKVAPRWMAGGARFTYRVRTPEGPQFVLVDPAAGTREPAFDHGRLATALAAAAEQPVADLPFAAIDLVDGAVEFDAFGAHWRCPLDSYTCTKAGQAANPLEVLSPDKRWAVFARDHNLWVRATGSGAEWALTADGTPDQSYGTLIDAVLPFTLMKKLGLPGLPPAVSWSPDSRRVLTHRTDQRDLRLTYLVESTPADGERPHLFTQRYALPGDEVLPHAELVVLDVEARTAVPAKAPPLLMAYLSPITSGWAWWADGAVFFLDQPRDVRTLRMHRLDPETGEVTLLVEETGRTRVEPAQLLAQKPNVAVLPGGEVLWYSQRDGWGHLYLYDGAGLRHQVTSGEWAVQEILHVDAQAGVVYFVASGQVADDPYRRQVCRVGLDGGGFAPISDGALDHAVTVPENRAYYVDSASTPDRPPVTSVRAWDGRELIELEQADVTALLAAGWSPPQRFRATAADGETDVFGLLYLPHDFDPAKRYPVIDNPYPGPQVNRLRPAFDQWIFGPECEAMAALGFVVVAVDGRGTPGRSKAFHDSATLADAGHLDDHVAAMRELAATRSWMDLDRVGIFGISGGGYATVRALCAFPEFYKVGVSLAGNHDQRMYHALWGERYDGPYDADTYARSSNVEIADRLVGKLLLMHGELDDNVTPHQTMRLVDALLAADKDFDLLIVPGAEHAFLGYEHIVVRRRWDYFVRHLAGVEPPAYRIPPAPLDMELVAMMMS